MGVASDISERKTAEASAQESRNLLETLANAAPATLWLSDAAGNITYVNQTWVEWTGLPRDAHLTSNNWTTAIVPEDQARVRQTFEEAFASRNPYEVEFRYNSRDGSPRWCIAKGVPRYDTHGTFVGYAGSGVDITEQKLTSEQIRVSEERYRCALEGSHDGMWDWDIATGEVFWNDRLYSTFGLDKASFSPSLRASLELTHPEDRAKMEEALKNHLEFGMPYELEVRQRHASGEYRTLLARGTALRDGDGKPYRMIGATIDITDRRRAKLALLESEERFRLLAESAPVTIWMSDESGGITYINKHWHQLTGASLAQSLGEGWLNFIHPDDREGFLEQFQLTLKAKASLHQEVRIRRPDGSDCWCLIYASPRLMKNGDCQGFVGILMDIDGRKRAEDALRESEARFRSLADAAPAMIALTDEQYRLTFTNQAWLEFLGCSQEALVGRGWLQYVHPEDREDYLKQLYANMQSHQRFSMEYRCRRHDGEDRWVFMEVFPRFDESGRFIGHISSNLDITERKHYEQQLRQNEERFRSLLESLQDAVWDWNVRTGELYWNPVFLDMLGLPRDTQPSYELFISLIHPDDREVLEQNVQAHLADPAVPYAMQFRIRHANGSYRYWLAKGSALRDASGQPYRMMGTDLDLTELLKTQEALRSSEAQFRTLAETLPHLVWSTDPAGRHTYCNQRWLDYTGLDFHSMGPDDWQAIIHPEDLPLNTSRWQTSLGTGVELEIEQRIRNREGDYHWFLTRALPVRDDQGQVVQWLGTCTNISEWVAAREAQSQIREELRAYARRLEQSNRDLEQFATIASHDLQAPLRKVRVFASHLRSQASDLLNPASLQTLDRIDRSVESMQQLIYDLLTLSRVSRADVVFAQVRLSDVLTASLDDLAPIILETGAQIRVDSALPILQGDSAQLQQLLTNLLSNALKFSREGVPPVIHITSDVSGGGPAMVELRIQDNGIGFEQQYLDRIFQVFQRLHGKTSRYPGTGVGLAICQKIVERHNGSITAEGLPGEGATFFVRLPLLQGQRSII